MGDIKVFYRINPAMVLRREIGNLYLPDLGSGFMMAPGRDYDFVEMFGANGVAKSRQLATAIGIKWVLTVSQPATQPQDAENTVPQPAHGQPDPTVVSSVDAAKPLRTSPSIAPKSPDLGTKAMTKLTRAKQLVDLCIPRGVISMSGLGVCTVTLGGVTQEFANKADLTKYMSTAPDEEWNELREKLI